MVSSGIVFVVALTRLATTADVEAAVLGPELGKGVYETRLVLNGGVPAVVLTTADREAAMALLASVRARGHGAVACDGDAVHFRRDMTSICKFRFDGEELVSIDGAGKSSHLRYDDVIALVRGVHRRNSTKTKEVTEKKFAMGRALLTGGLASNKSVSREVIESTEEREEVLYLFRHDNARPWILVDAEARYQGLADRLARTQRENFIATVECLRAMCPGAGYDEHILTNKRVPERFTRVTTGKAAETSSADGVDLLAHLMALAIARGQV